MIQFTKIYSAIFLLLSVSIIYLYPTLQNANKKLIKNVNELFTVQAEDFAKNICDEVLHETPQNLRKEFSQNSLLQNELEKEMQLMTTDTFQYIFILYKDPLGKYRYLVDASREDRGAFGDKLNVDTKAWDDVWQSREKKLISHKNLETLWTTLLYPIVVNGKTEAIIAIDFSIAALEKIKEALNPIKKIFLIIFLALFLMIAVTLFQFYYTFRTKQENFIDPLTNIYNRNYLREFIDKSTISSYIILMVDIDHFKQVNDTYGHACGDKVLKDVANIIQKSIGKKDKVIRFGGEEFILFIKKSSNITPFNRAEHIRKSIAEYDFHYDSTQLKITISIGATCHPEKFKQVSDAIKHADEMLYIAKRDGRNQVVIAQVKKSTESTKNSLPIYKVQEAIEEGRVLCHYQPIFNIKTKRIIKYEALVRIEEEDGSIISPMRFIPIVMHTNVYNLLTKKIMEIVFAKIKKEQFTISLNLNFSDIINHDIFDLIITQLEQNRDFAPLLVIELLEYEPLDGNDKFVQNLQKIKSYGVKIAIDDFGSGFANYTLFQSLPIDIVKIDASIIKNIDRSDISKSIVKSILTLTDELQLESLAEFVHSKSVLDVLKELGVTSVQGYHLGKPQKDFIQT